MPVEWSDSLGIGVAVRIAEHRAAHEQFVGRLSALARERDGGASAFLALRARKWIVVWLLDHVGGTDQLLGRWLRGRAPAGGGATRG